MNQTIPLRVMELKLQLGLIGAKNVSVDAPSNPEGEWFVDFSLATVQDAIAWYPGKGFGVWEEAQAYYGTGPDHVLPTAQEAVSKWLEFSTCG